MTLYSFGDIVLCKVNLNKIVGANATKFDNTHHFDIICPCDRGYLILVPSTVILTNSFVLTARDCVDFNIPYKFMKATSYFINDDHVVSLINKMTGLCCAVCKEYFAQAEVNRIDKNGKGILVCWSCRTYKPYKCNNI